MMQLVVEQNTKAIRTAWRWTVVWHVLLGTALLIGVWVILFDPKSDDVPGALFISMAALAGFIVIKFWYYLTAARLGLETKLKELELGAAEIREALEK